MPEMFLYNLVITAFFGALAGLGVLVTAAKEKERLWGRYQQLKSAAEHEQEMRQRRLRELRKVAQKANLAEEGPLAPSDIDAA